MSSDLNYEKLSDELQNKINTELFDGNGFKVVNAIRRIDKEHDRATLWRPAFVRDVEKIMHSPYYNRYADKTQVFSFYKNDDISHRALHVQLVSRIARNIGRMLGLDLDLIEAVALGHDIRSHTVRSRGRKILKRIYIMQIRDDISITTYTVCVCLIKYLTSTSAFKHLTEYFVTTVSSSAKNTVRQSLTISRILTQRLKNVILTNPQ